MQEVITLNDVEQTICFLVARKRFQNARRLGIPNAKIDQKREYVDLDGFGGELAFCRSFNLYPDLSIEIKEWDAVLRDGRTVDIKTTKYEQGHLLVWGEKQTDKKADLYLLMIGKLPTYRFAGYIEVERLFKKENIKSFGYGASYALSQEELRKF